MNILIIGGFIIFFSVIVNILIKLGIITFLSNIIFLSVHSFGIGETMAKKASQTPTAVTPSNTDLPKGVVDEAILNWTDLTGAKTGATSKGSNKYYKAQILEAAGGFKIVFNYGRVGQTGQTKVETASTLDAAKRIFESKISAKMSKGYRRLEMRSQHDEVAKAKKHGVEVTEKAVKKVVKKKVAPPSEKPKAKPLPMPPSPVQPPQFK